MNFETHSHPATSSAAVESAVTMDGRVGRRCTRMLVDTGSAVTIVSEKTWREATRGEGLESVARPVVAANGQQLEVLGKPL